MENAVNEIIRLRMEKTKNALENNNMTAYTVKTKEEAADIVRSLLKKGDVIASGGSVTLNQCGITDIIKSPDYIYLDRNSVARRLKYLGNLFPPMFIFAVLTLLQKTESFIM